jgi:hypothetical protein
MAVVGQLLVELSANVARLRTDMESAVGVMQKNSDRMTAAADGAKKAIAAIGVGFGVNEIVTAFGAITSQLAEFDDAAQKTGISVESLSATLNQLSPTGVTLEQITSTSERLVKSMIGADKETGKAAEAFGALGIATRDADGNLRQTDVVLREIAEKLYQYEAGANKTAIAQALLGKSGADALPMLKDMVELQTQNSTVTTKAAAAAADFEDQLGKIKRAGEIFRQSIVSSIIPELLKLIEQFNAGREAAGGFFNAMARYGLALGSPQQNIDRLNKSLDEMNKKLLEDGKFASGNNPTFNERARRAAEARVAQTRADIDQALKDLTYFRTLQDQMGATNLLSNALYDASVTKAQAPAISSGIKAETAAKEDLAARNAYTRMIDQLYAQMDLTEAQKLALKTAQDALPKTSALYDQGAQAAARMADSIKQAKKDQDDLTEALKAFQGVEDVNVGESQRLANMIAMRKETEITLAGFRLLTKVRDEANGTTENDKIRDYLRTMQEAGAASAEEVEKVKRLLDATKDSAKDLLAPIESAFEAIVVGGGSARQVLQGLLTDLTRVLLRTQVTGPLSKALEGAAGGAGGILGALMNSFRPSAEATALAAGITPLATGGPAEAGHPYLVGEKGPELMVPRSSGTIIPNHALGGASVNLTYNIAPGVSAAQVLQALNATREQTKADIMESMRRGGAFAR